MEHGDHGGMHGDQCSMNMLFHWDTQGLCVVFESWRVRGPISLFFTLLAVVLLTAAYEGVRETSRRFEARNSATISAFSTGASSENESSSLLTGRGSKGSAERRGNIIRGALYAVQVMVSMFVMLLFMTYNGWIMLAVGVGAFVGYLAFGKQLSSTKTVACH